MHSLRRSVRFCINDAPTPPGVNGFAASPPLLGFAPWIQIDITCRGTPDPVTSYLIDIKDVDRAVRETLAPRLEAAYRAAGTPLATLASSLADLTKALPAPLATVAIRQSPYHCFEMAANDPTRVLVRIAFDFAAAHRLNSLQLSPEENRRLYGKCNTVNGHGHNYRIEPSIEVSLSPRGEPSLGVAEIERITNDTIISRFDHKHLNLDTPEFNESTGVNPSVENIARVFFDLLAPAVARSGGVLRSITVWETDRTCATYPA